MLQRQQEQLNKLTESIALLQAPHQHSHPPRIGPMLCRRCNQPGHFARECTLLAHNPIHSPHLILVGSLIMLLGRKTSAHRTAEPQFGWGRYSQVLPSSSELISLCPHLDVDMGGVKAPCLVDTGSMVSIISPFFYRYFAIFFFFAFSSGILCLWALSC